jgi:pyruvate formate lyase activating enzyme
LPPVATSAAKQITESRKKHAVNRMAISGGESTLNPGWLVGYLRAAKAMNPDNGARFHVDTNGSLLTPDYIDRLVDAGMSDVGIDLKAWNLDTFMKICGIAEDTLAERYRDTAWRAVRHIREEYGDRIFLGIGIPYNPGLISLEEIALMGRKIFDIDPGIQVCALDYRPEFKRMDLFHPSFSEMEEVGEALRDAGLTTVLCQTVYGHIGP